ncbi:MAG: terpene cyclase/mutase family protein [Planctomycetes bacterium]|nr:terpene cyclase/mutase family protein [Planctomycetota bacterium]
MFRLVAISLAMLFVMSAGTALSAAPPDTPDPFGGRTGEAKAKLVKDSGGNAASEAAVAQGLAWLAKQQKQDGGWEYDVGDKTERTAATGMCLLAFLGAGETHHNKGKYTKTIQNGLNFLIKSVPLGGQNAGKFNGAGSMYGQAIGTLALCEAYGMTRDKLLLPPAQAAVNYIQKAQGANGSWGYISGTNGDTSIVGWQIQALQAARLAKDIKVDEKVIKRAIDFLDVTGAGAAKDMYGYTDNTGAAPATSLTSIGLLCRYYIDGWAPDHDSMVKGIAGMMKRAPKVAKTGPDLYFHYYATQLVHYCGDDAWKTWNEGAKDDGGTRKGGMRDWLVGLQVADDGAKQGSWDPDPGWIGRSCGRLGTTAMSVLTLEVYYRYKPGLGESALKLREPKK